MFYVFQEVMFFYYESKEGIINPFIFTFRGKCDDRTDLNFSVCYSSYTVSTPRYLCKSTRPPLHVTMLVKLSVSSTIHPSTMPYRMVGR